MNTIIILLLYGSVFVTAERLYAKGIPADITRKIVHIGSGVISALLPLVMNLTTALTLGVIGSAVLVISKRTQWLGSVHAIRERSVGAILFGPSLMLTAILYWPVNVLAYQGACLVLGCSDGIAGLVGKFYGKKQFAFFSITLVILLSFLFRQHPTLLPGDIISALGGSIVLTLGEALIGNGWDNLFVPVATGAILTLLL